MRRTVLSIGVAAVFFLSACGDDDGGSSGSSGTGGSSGSSGASGASGASGMGGSCAIDAQHVTEAELFQLSNLSVAGDKVVFIASDTRTRFSTVEVVGVDGTGRMTLHSPTGSRRVGSAKADGDSAYFLEKTEDAVSRYELFSVPLAGGAAAAVGGAGIESGYIIGFDATHVFVLEELITSSRVVRIAKSDGASEIVGGATTGATYYHVQLAGEDVFFVAGAPAVVYGVPKAASDATAIMLWEAPMTNDPCGFPLGGLLAAGDRLVCGYTSLATRELDGTGESLVFGGTLDTGFKFPIASDGARYYHADPNLGGALVRRSVVDGDVTVIACDTGRLGNKLADAFFPIQMEYEGAVGTNDVFWIEVGMDSDSNATFRIRRAAK